VQLFPGRLQPKKICICKFTRRSGLNKVMKIEKNMQPQRRSGGAPIPKVGDSGASKLSTAAALRDRRRALNLYTKYDEQGKTFTVVIM